MWPEDLHEQFLEASEETKRSIIHIGTRIYYNGLRWVSQEQHEDDLNRLRSDERLHKARIQELQEEYQRSLRESMQVAAQHHDAQIEQTKVHIASGYDELVKSLRSQLESTTAMFAECKQNIEKSYEVVVGNLNVQLEDAKLRITDLEEKNISAMDISGRLDSLVGKRSAIDNAAKGDFGESVVYRQIISNYAESAVDDTSGLTAAGDMIWRMDNNKFRALVEVKNVQCVRQSDLTKFERDLSVNVQNGTCNCAMFVSLKAEHIPGKGSFCVEFANGVPVVYVAGVFSEEHILKIALQVLRSVHGISGGATHGESEQYQQFIVAFVQEACRRISSSRRNILAMRTSLESMTLSLASEERNVKYIADGIDQLTENVPWLGNSAPASPEHDLQTKRQKLIQAVKQFREEHTRWPTVDEIVGAHEGISRNSFRGTCTMASLRSEIEARAN